MKISRRGFVVFFSLFGAGWQARADEVVVGAEPLAGIDSGDTAWMIVATALVLFMTIPGLALFYGGLVRGKNVLSILMQCFVLMAVMSLLWVLYGYSFAAGDGGAYSRYIGDGSMLLLKHLTVDVVNGSIPESVFITFQMTFAIITPALMVGAFAERMKFIAILLFSVLWFTFSYLPIWHMAWGGGLFHEWKVFDFAGGTVVHINAGVAALIACIFVGKRQDFGKLNIMPHNLPFTVIGAGMLWVGWFGFNAGSQLAADGAAGMAMLVTQIAAATATLTWVFIEWVKHGKPSALGAATGAVAGLVAITPAAGTAGPLGAILLGFSSSVVCFFCATTLKAKLGYDDSLDVFGVHGMGGIVGAILTGVTCLPWLGGSGLAHETVGAQVWYQTLSVIVTLLWSGVVSVVILFILRVTVGLRVDEDAEVQGLDLAEHDERAYAK